MEITATCTICEQKFTYEKNITKTHNTQIRKLCDGCRKTNNTQLGKHAIKYAIKKKRCKTIDNDINLLKLMYEMEKNEKYMKLNKTQQIKTLSKKQKHTEDYTRNKIRDLMEFGLIDITKNNGRCLTLAGILMVKYDKTTD